MAISAELASKLDKVIEEFDDFKTEAQAVFKQMCSDGECALEEAKDVGRKKHSKRREDSETRDEDGDDLRSSEGDPEGSKECSDESRV